VFHRVVTLGRLGDLYRGQVGYPGTPSQALTMHDTSASLIDDLQAAAAPAAKSPPGAPSSPPAPAPAPPSDK